MQRLTFDLDTWEGRNLSADALRSRAAATPGQMPCLSDQAHRYYTNVPAALLDQQGNLIDQLMGFAYSLGAQHLEIQIRDDE
jgi:hypothetical protein